MSAILVQSLLLIYAITSTSLMTRVRSHWHSQLKTNTPSSFVKSSNSLMTRVRLIIVPLKPENQGTKTALVRRSRTLNTNRCRKPSVEAGQRCLLVRGVPLTHAHFTISCCFLFTLRMRPIESGVFALKHKDIEVRNEPNSLVLHIYGKTGYRRGSSTKFRCEVLRAYARKDTSHPARR